ncbi:MAG: helix-turn-helix domain-containing protein [Acidobacteriota bacterium]
MASLGQELKKRREEKGITIHQIATSTLIGARFLQAIEADDYSPLPGGVFNRAFVRKFANYIGMDEATALQLYEDQLALQGVEPAPKFEMGVENWDAPPTTGNGLLISLVLLVILSVGAWLAYTYFYATKTPPEEAAVAEQNVVAPPPNASSVASPSPEPSPSASPAVEEKVVEGLVLRIESGTAPCWMRVIRDGEPAEESIQQPGQSREFAARERLVLSLGNLPTLRVTINGRLLNPAKVLKTPKSVVVSNLLLTRENYLNYID